jgi:hypothetical protein
MEKKLKYYNLDKIELKYVLFCNLLNILKLHFLTINKEILKIWIKLYIRINKEVKFKVILLLLWKCVLKDIIIKVN